LQRCSWLGNACSDFFNFLNEKRWENFAYIRDTRMGHYIASVQKIVYCFIDFPVVRGITALLSFLIEERGLALSQCTFVEKVLKFRASSGERVFLKRSSSLRFLRRSFSSLLESRNEWSRAMGLWGREGATASIALRKPVLIDATSSSGWLDLCGKGQNRPDSFKDCCRSNLLIDLRSRLLVTAVSRTNGAAILDGRTTSLSYYLPSEKSR